ncbi:MAG: hypothetical protein ACRDA4_06405 [Filifactoraceae bacterium]
MYKLALCGYSGTMGRYIISETERYEDISIRVYAVGTLNLVPKIIGKNPGFYAIEDL